MRQSQAETLTPPDGLSGVAAGAPRKTAQEAWEQLRDRGISARDWALQNGFEPTLVYSVLSGKRKCLRGKSHQVAKALGVK